VERLLAISGEDDSTIDRKYRDPWTGRLPTRFLVLSNELPKLSDASGTIVSRFVLFTLEQSFYGRENPALTDELLAEAPAIFNWSLEGFDRLLRRGHFEQPASGTQAIRAMEDLASPVNAFIRYRCDLGADKRVDVEVLWTAWRTWCTESNNAPGTKATFGRDLRTVVPTLKVSRPRQQDDRVQRYDGIALRTDTVPSRPDHPDQTPSTDEVADDLGLTGQGGQGNSGMYPSRRSMTDEVQAKRVVETI
jgi:putative DNA primase/helicase